jgi:hypothetical protein
MTPSRMSIKCAAIAFTAFTAAAANEIHGRVIDSQTGEGIERTRITFSVLERSASRREPVVMVALTNPDGTFQISNLPNGSCQIWGDRSGYLAGSGRAESKANITLQDSKEPVQVLLRLTRQAVIEGRILDENGEGIAGQLRLLRQAQGRVDAVNHLFVDPGGDFRLAGLDAGRYYLAISAPQYGITAPRAYPTVYYPRARDFQSAKPIDLQSGQQEHIEFRMAEVPAYEVRGRIHPASQSVNLSLQLSGEPSMSDGIATWDAPSGTFKITGVPAGTYLLTAILVLDGQAHRASQTVKVSDSDIDGIVLQPVPDKSNR